MGTNMVRVLHGPHGKPKRIIMGKMQALRFGAFVLAATFTVHTSPAQPAGSGYARGNCAYNNYRVNKSRLSAIANII
jgi:hypothetical protein